MSTKAFGDYYSYQHCLNLLTKRKEGLTPREFLEDAKEQSFYYRETSDQAGDFKWAERILEGIYRYHGELGDAPEGKSNIIECHGTASKARYKIKAGTELPFNPSLSETVSVLTLAADSLKHKILPGSEESLRSLYPLVSQSKSNKLKSLYTIKDAGYEVVIPDMQESVLKDVESALDRRSPISFDYANATRHVDPYGLFVYGKVFYLVGYERYKSGVTEKVMTGMHRTYALHRMSDTQIHTNSSFAMGANKDFSLDDYLSSDAGKFFNGGSECKVTLKFKKNHSGTHKFVDEYQLSKCQTVEFEDENHYVVNAVAHDCLDFRKWLVTNASNVEIVSPLHIRDRVINDLKKAANTYSVFDMPDKRRAKSDENEQPIEDHCHSLRMLESECLVLDTETTGLDNPEIVELSIVDSSGEILFDSLIKPKQPMSEKASMMTGITNEMLADANSWEDVYPQVKRLLQGKPIAAYNSDFDQKVINIACSNLGLPPIEADFHCVMKEYARYRGEWNNQYKSYKWHKLSAAIDHERVKADLPYHRALNDTYLTLELMKVMSASYR
ncbi:WYL domain-containing protein [Vibrio sp. 1F255]|uniref:exonuclease domain-containing protein n=1 Tax=Vibrio sp. 1F255 TaxID=3230009 RepID=UPI00352F9E52